GLEGQVTTLATGGVAAGWTILDQGQADSVMADDPVILPKGKYRVLFYVRDYIPEVTWTVGITTRAYAKAHPEIVRGLIAARREALQFMRSHRVETARLFARDWQFEEPLAVEMLDKLFAANYWSDGDFNMKGLRVMVDGMAMVGAVEKPVDLD